MLTGAHRLGHRLFKKHRGELRTLYAEFLAVHLLTAECQLVDAIISELLSPAELEWMKQPGQTNSSIVGLIADKMKTV